VKGRKEEKRKWIDWREGTCAHRNNDKSALVTRSEVCAGLCVWDD